LVPAGSAVLVIVAAHWPWAQATLTPPAPDVLKSPGQVTGLYAHARPAPWAGIYAISDGASFPWWSQPEFPDGTTLAMTMSYGAPVAAAAALTSLISGQGRPARATRRDQLEDARRGQVLLVDPHAERGQRILDRVDHRRR